MTPSTSPATTHVLTGLNYQNVRWSFIGIHDANWIPFTWLSLILDAQFFGTGPFGFHFTNVVLHVANTLLLFYILFTTTQCPGDVTRSLPPSLRFIPCTSNPSPGLPSARTS